MSSSRYSRITRWLVGLVACGPAPLVPLEGRSCTAANPSARTLERGLHTVRTIAVRQVGAQPKGQMQFVVDYLPLELISVDDTGEPSPMECFDAGQRGWLVNGWARLTIAPREWQLFHKRCIEMFGKNVELRPVRLEKPARWWVFFNGSLAHGANNTAPAGPVDRPIRVSAIFPPELAAKRGSLDVLMQLTWRESSISRSTVTRRGTRIAQMLAKDARKVDVRLLDAVYHVEEKRSQLQTAVYRLTGKSHRPKLTGNKGTIELGPATPARKQTHPRRKGNRHDSSCCSSSAKSIDGGSLLSCGDRSARTLRSSCPKHRANQPARASVRFGVHICSVAWQCKRNRGLAPCG